MVDKREYYKLMFFAFCLIVLLLMAGTYSYFHSSKGIVFPGEDDKILAIACVLSGYDSCCVNEGYSLC